MYGYCVIMVQIDTESTTVQINPPPLHGKGSPPYVIFLMAIWFCQSLLIVDLFQSRDELLD